MGNQSVWYYQKETFFNPVEEGPFTLPQLKALAANGSLKMETLVRSPEQTMNAWVHAGKFKPLAILINQAKMDADTLKQQEKIQKQQAKEVAKQQAAEQRQQIADQKRQMEIAKQASEQEAQLSAQRHQQQMQLQQAQHAAAAPPQPQVIVVNSGADQSNVVPVLLNMFLWPGLGQIVQGRALAGIFLMMGWVISLLMIMVFIGFFMAPLIYIAALIDAAMYRPR